MPIKLPKKAEEVFHEPCKLTRSWSVRSKTPSVLYHGVTLILTHQIRNFEMIYLSSLLVLHHGLTELQWQTPAAILIACAARGLDPRIRKHISLWSSESRAVMILPYPWLVHFVAFQRFLTTSYIFVKTWFNVLQRSC